MAAWPWAWGRARWPLLAFLPEAEREEEVIRFNLSRVREYSVI